MFGVDVLDDEVALTISRGGYLDFIDFIDFIDFFLFPFTFVLPTALHAKCFKMWSQTVAKTGKAITCVFCRANWSTDASGSSNAASTIDTTGP